jgi:myosin heavy subunit
MISCSNVCLVRVTLSIEAAMITFYSAGLLWLGNITFKEHGHGSAVQEGAHEALHHAARLLGLEADELRKCLCQTSFRARGEDTVIRFTPVQCAAVRDAMARAIYGRFFDWIEKQINSSMCVITPVDGAIIGVLDIFGFERFEKVREYSINLCNCAY